MINLSGHPSTCYSLRGLSGGRRLAKDSQFKKRMEGEGTRVEVRRSRIDDDMSVSEKAYLTE